MPNPCPSCSKLCSLETEEPEIQTEELNAGVVTIEVRLVRNSACCGEEMKEATFTYEKDYTDELMVHVQENHPENADDLTCFELELGDPESTESGGGRYKKNMIGVQVPYTITCTLCKPLGKTCAIEPVVSDEMKDEMQASGFDELV